MFIGCLAVGMWSYLLVTSDKVIIICFVRKDLLLPRGDPMVQEDIEFRKRLRMQKFAKNKSETGTHSCINPICIRLRFNLFCIPSLDFGEGTVVNHNGRSTMLTMLRNMEWPLLAYAVSWSKIGCMILQPQNLVHQG